MFWSFKVDGWGTLSHYFECLSEYDNSFLVSQCILLWLLHGLLGKKLGFCHLDISQFYVYESNFEW